VVDFSAFTDELLKIAEAGAIPVVSRIPMDADKAFETIKKRIDKSGRDILGHPNVAVPVERFGDLTQHGFKKTRLAVPLPGERLGAPSWRKDDLHAHRSGEHYLMHKDKIAPRGALQSMRHLVREGIPASRLRMRSRQSAVIGGT
jgi:hypothetical protein